MDLSVAATAFALVFPVELPDKTFVASLVLATRFRPGPVWFGVAAAFLVHTAIAVAAGGLLALLPAPVVTAAAAVLFAIGAVVLWRGAEADAAVVVDSSPEGADGAVPAWRAATTSFGVLFVAEMGDLSQLLTAGLAARYDDPISVFTGSWLALLTVAGLAVVVGRALAARLRLSLIRRIGAGICATLAVLATYDLVRGTLSG